MMGGVPSSQWGAGAPPAGNGGFGNNAGQGAPTGNGGFGLGVAPPPMPGTGFSQMSVSTGQNRY